MTHAKDLAYLATALASLYPTARWVSYLMDMTKARMTALTANEKRGVVVILGVIILTALANGITVSGLTGAPFDLRAIPFDIIAGIAAGFYSLGDYHLTAALQDVEANNIPGAINEIAQELAPSTASESPALASASPVQG